MLFCYFPFSQNEWLSPEESTNCRKAIPISIDIAQYVDCPKPFPVQTSRLTPGCFGRCVQLFRLGSCWLFRPSMVLVLDCGGVLSDRQTKHPPNFNLHQTAVDGAFPFVHCFIHKYGEKELHGDTEPGKQLRRWRKAGEPRKQWSRAILLPQRTRSFFGRDSPWILREERSGHDARRLEAGVRVLETTTWLLRNLLQRHPRKNPWKKDAAATSERDGGPQQPTLFFCLLHRPWKWHGRDCHSA